MMGNLKKKFGVNKMKQKFDEEKKIKSIIKNKAIDSFQSVGKNNFSKKFSSDVILDKNLFVNLNTFDIKEKISNEIDIDQDSEYHYDSTPPNINRNKMPITSNKFHSMGSIKRNASSNVLPNKYIQKTLSSTITGFKKENIIGKQTLEAINYIQRNKTGNQFLKSKNNFYETFYNKNKLDSNNTNFDMEEYFNLMNSNNNNQHEEKSSIEINLLNRYLANDVKKNSNLKAKNDVNNKSQNSFYDSPYKRNKISSINEMRNLEVLKKLAFKEEPKKIIYEIEETDFY